MIKLYLYLLPLIIGCNAIHPGPVVRGTKGAIWPKPVDEKKTDQYYIVRPYGFNFKRPYKIGCPNLLNDACTRYWTTIVTSFERHLQAKGHQKPKTEFWKDDSNYLGDLTSLDINLISCPSEHMRPQYGDIENYTVIISTEEAAVTSDSLWGIFHGLETFTQLIYVVEDTLIINVTHIGDYPRFLHRGLLLDTSRHFIPVSDILQTLDAMSYNKMNVFHWHLTDDHSFPYKSGNYPELSDKGAYHPESKIYEQYDVTKVIEYARVRGIRVIPEFDIPGHTSSWGASHPELLTTCYTNDKPNGDLGPMDPTKDTTYDFLKTFFTEVRYMFPDAYIHIGGDEVDFSCWKSNPNVTSFMQANNILTYEGLEAYFMQKVITTLQSLKFTKYLVWEEVFVNGVELPPNNTLVHVWRDNGHETLNDVTKAGNFAIFSSCWYLDHLSNGGDWEKFYECEAVDFPGTDMQKHMVLGGEACMWTEAVNEYNLMSRVWPRASAVAEKLWSPEDVKDTEEARARLEEHTCRMNKRGIAAQPPNGPGVCL